MQTDFSLGEIQSPASKYDPETAKAILVADCGTVVTKVSLLGLVEGQYRLMARGEAPTTVAAPHKDITRGIIEAVEEIQRVTGHRFVSKKGRILSPQQMTGDGIDLFVAAISAGGPIRMVVLGAVSPQLAELAKQAISGLYAETHAIPSPTFSSSRESSQGSWTAERTKLEWETPVAEHARTTAACRADCGCRGNVRRGSPSSGGLPVDRELFAGSAEAGDRAYQAVPRCSTRARRNI